MFPSTPTLTRRGALAGLSLLVANGLIGCSTNAASPTRTSPTWIATPTESVSAVSSEIALPATKTELEAVARSRVLFGHQSIGMSLLDAFPSIFQAASVPVPTIANTEWPQARDTKTEPVIAQAWIGKNGDPKGKIRDFAAIFDKPIGATLEVALMKLGAVDFDVSTDIQAVFRDYTSTMDRLEAAHPDTVFLHSTATLTTQGDEWSPTSVDALGTIRDAVTDNAQRERYNALVRTRYGDSGLLFDIADLESQVGDGKVAAAGGDGPLYRVMNPTMSSDGLHLNPEGAQRIANALLHLMGQAVLSPRTSR
jgi:hypothetical protein